MIARIALTRFAVAEVRASTRWSANALLGIDPLLRNVSAVAVFFMALALVGLGTGLGARYPRFNAENPSQVAGRTAGCPS